MEDIMNGADDLIKQLEQEARAGDKAEDDKGADAGAADDSGDGADADAAGKGAGEGADEGTQDGKAGDEDADGDGEEEDVADGKQDGKAHARRRHQFKELREQLAQEREARAADRERLARLEGRAEAHPKQEDKKETTEDAEPDRDLYPDEHKEWKIRRLEERLEKNEKMMQEGERARQFQNELSGVQYLENEFAKANPDYAQAEQFLFGKERRAKKILNPDWTDAQIDARIKAEKVGFFKQLAARKDAAGNPVNAAEVLYKLAKEDGWAPKGKEEKKEQKKDFSKIADNQRKGASLIGGTGTQSANGKISSDAVFGAAIESLMGKSDKFWADAENAARKGHL